MDKEELLMDIIHRLEDKIDRIESQVSELTGIKDKMVGIIAVISVACTMLFEYIKNIFAVR